MAGNVSSISARQHVPVERWVGRQLYEISDLVEQLREEIRKRPELLEELRVLGEKLRELERIADMGAREYAEHWREKRRTDG